MGVCVCVCSGGDIDGSVCVCYGGDVSDDSGDDRCVFGGLCLFVCLFDLFDLFVWLLHTSSLISSCRPSSFGYGGDNY